MALTPQQKWLMNGKVNAIFARADAMTPKPQEMLATEAIKMLRSNGLSYSDCSEVMRSSKYAAHAKSTGFPLCALPLGQTEPDPPTKPKPSFWKPAI